MQRSAAVMATAPIADGPRGQSQPVALAQWQGFRYLLHCPMVLLRKKVEDWPEDASVPDPMRD
eukprot:13733364-Alexandrium_andersonii.AAC.1